MIITGRTRGISKSKVILEVFSCAGSFDAIDCALHMPFLCSWVIINKHDDVNSWNRKKLSGKQEQPNVQSTYSVNFL